MAKTQTKGKKLAADDKNLVPELRNNVLAATKEHIGDLLDEQSIALLPQAAMQQMKADMQDIMDNFRHIANNNLTALQRKRKIGAGIRNYGFIEKVADIATSNPEFAQFFDIADLRNSIRNIEACRDFVILLQSFSRLVSNTMMIYSDAGYSMALLYYNLVKEMSRRGNPAAMEIFRLLRPFFRKSRNLSAEPTAKELEKDFHSLLKGTKDGKIVIENEKPRISGGKHLVVDKTHSNKKAFKETLEGEISH